jgi:hypothetical protein
LFISAKPTSATEGRPLPELVEGNITDGGKYFLDTHDTDGEAQNLFFYKKNVYFCAKY